MSFALDNKKNWWHWSRMSKKYKKHLTDLRRTMTEGCKTDITRGEVRDRKKLGESLVTLLKNVPGC